VESEGYTLTGLSKKEVENIGTNRYVSKHWKPLLIPMFIGVVIIMASVMLEDGSWKQDAMQYIGLVVTAFFLGFWLYQQSKAGEKFFKEVTNK
jgi:hypothetical protein